MAKAGLYALGFVLFGVLMIGASSVYGGFIHDQPGPLRDLMS